MRTSPDYLNLMNENKSNLLLFLLYAVMVCLLRMLICFKLQTIILFMQDYRIKIQKKIFVEPLGNILSGLVATALKVLYILFH